MLNREELDNLYDPTQTQQGPGPKSRPLPTIKDVDNPHPSSFTLGKATQTDVSHYGSLLDNGVYSDQDIESQMGQHQSILAKTGHMLGNLPGNIIGSFIEGIGDLGLLAGQYGDDRTYTNALTEAGKKLHNLTGDIYMSNPHSTIGATLSDPGWWLDQIGGLAEFGVSYAALGAGIGGTISKLAEGTAGLIRAGEFGGRALQGLGQLGTAGLMSYTMGAQSGAQVFQQTYDTQFRKFLDAGDAPDEASQKARHIAAQSAATTAQLTTAIGTALALGSMGAYFRKASTVVPDILKKEVPQRVGEDFAQWAERVRSIDPGAYAKMLNPTGSISHKLLEMGKMGVEMQQLQFGSKTGEELGREGKVKGFLDQFDELQHYFDRTMDKDGALAFAIGSVSGLGIDFMRNNVIPSKWADKLDPNTGLPMPKVNENGEETGQFQKGLYTPKAYTNMHMAAKFINMRDAIASDIKNFDEMHKSYLAASKADDPIATEKAALDLFNVNNVNAITNGTKDVWQSTYNQIANLSPEEAFKRGYAAKEGDTSFQEKAQKASTALDRYQKIYEDLQYRYGTRYEMNQGFKPVVDGIFSRKVQIDAWEQMLQEHETDLKRMNAAQDVRLSISDPELFDQHTSEYYRTWDSAIKTRDKLAKDLSTVQSLLNDYNDPAKRNNASLKMAAIAREYSAIDPDGNNSPESVSKAMIATAERIKEAHQRQGDRIKQAEDNLLASSGFNDWKEKNPDGTFKEYMRKVNDNVTHDEYQHQIELSKEKLNIAKKNVAEMEKEKNLNRLAHKYQKYMESVSRMSDDLDRQYNREISLRAKAEATFDQTKREQLNRLSERYKGYRDAHINEFDSTMKELKNVQEQLKTAAPEAANALKTKERELQTKARGLSTKIDRYHQLFLDTHMDTPEPPQSVDTNNITITPTTGSEPMETISSFSAEQSVHETEIPSLEEMMKENIEQEAKETMEKVASVHETQDHLSDVLSQHLGMQDAYMLMADIKAYLRGDIALDAIRDKVNPEIMEAIEAYQKAIQDNPIDGQLSLTEQMIQAINETEEEPNQIYRADIDKPEDPITDLSTFADPNNNFLAMPITAGEAYRQMGFSGAKTVDAATAANLTLEYVELAPDKNGEIQIANKKDVMNEKVNPDLFKPSKLQAGTKLRFEVATDYNGPKNITGSLKQDEYGNRPEGHETFQDFIDKNGRIPSDKMGNVPIRIIDDATGRTVGWVRKHEWVTERYTDSRGNVSKPRNIAEIFDNNGNEINMAAQSKKILDIRKAIVDQWNSNKGHTTGVISNKGAGHVILNQDYNINTDKKKAVKYGYAFNRTNPEKGLLPDPKLIITISDNGTYKAGKGFMFNKPIIPGLDAPRNGTIHAMLPGANGEHIPVPLIGKSLGEGETAHRTIVRAIELYLQYTGSEEEQATHEIDKLKDKTGFDISNEKGLRDFINQYFTYTQRFDDTATIPTYKDTRKFLFNIWDKIPGKEGKAWIKAGWTESGQRPIYAGLDQNGKLNQEFADLLRDGIATRSKAVVYTRDGVRGINEHADTPFVDAIYTTKGWRHNTYSDYNEYVKSFSQTTAFGRNKLGDQYVYVSNPPISYDMDIKPESSPTLVEENPSPTKVQLPEPKTESHNEALANELDDIFNALPAKEPSKVKGIGDGGEKSKPLNLKTLEDLYNFTPEDQRNGRTPSDVLKDLTSRGHSFLSDGYNPFTLCL